MMSIPSLLNSLRAFATMLDTVRPSLADLLVQSSFVGVLPNPSNQDILLAAVQNVVVAA
jgi:hypothetical protein